MGLGMVCKNEGNICDICHNLLHQKQTCEKILLDKKRGKNGIFKVNNGYGYLREKSFCIFEQIKNLMFFSFNSKTSFNYKAYKLWSFIIGRCNYLKNFVMLKYYEMIKTILGKSYLNIIFHRAIDMHVQ